MAAPAKRITLYLTSIERSRYEAAAEGERLGLRSWLELAALRSWVAFKRDRHGRELGLHMADKPIGDRLREKLGGELDTESREIMDRLLHLRLALKEGAALTDKSGPTADGHIRSAISKLERELELRRVNRKL